MQNYNQNIVINFKFFQFNLAFQPKIIDYQNPINIFVDIENEIKKLPNIEISNNIEDMMSSLSEDNNE